jgi:hypothetical protein
MRLPPLYPQPAWDTRYAASGRIQQKIFFSSLKLNNTSIVAYVFVAAGTCLQSRCLAMNMYSGSDIPTFKRHVTMYVIVTLLNNIGL